MHRVELGRIAFKVVADLVAGNNLQLNHVEQFLRQQSVYRDDIRLFMRVMTKQLAWWHRRCEELALLTVIAMLEQSANRFQEILTALNAIKLDDESQTMFIFNLVQHIGRRKEARASIDG